MNSNSTVLAAGMRVTGGPCKYTGESMKEAHAHLHITDNEWKVMAAEFKKSLHQF